MMAEQLPHIFEPQVHDQHSYNHQCLESTFIMIGFLNDIFPKEVNLLKQWAAQHDSKLFYAVEHIPFAGG